MKIRALLCISLFFGLSNSAVLAQNRCIIVYPYVWGPNEVCVGECATYQVGVSNSSSYDWFVMDEQEEIVLHTEFSAGELNYCFDQTGTFIIYAIDPSPTFPITQRTVHVTEYWIPDISPISTDFTCLDAPGVCQKVCKNSTVIYEADNSENLPMEWEVIGAADYFFEGNRAIVTWGEEGLGELRASITEVPQPFKLNCGQIRSESGPGLEDGQGFVYINGGTPPYSLTITGPGAGLTYPASSGFNQIDVMPSGTFMVSVTDGNGEIANCSFEIVLDGVCSVSAYGEVSVPSDCESCDGSIVLTVFNSSSELTYQWSTGQTTKDISNLCEGSYSVTITNDADCSDVQSFEITCSTNCTGTNAVCVEILDAPISAFTAMPLNANNAVEVCTGQSVYFENTSIGAVTYQWSFGNGATSSNANPVYEYPEAGTYEVALYAANDCNCKDTSYATVIVMEAAVPEIKCKGTVCQNDVVRYETEEDCGIFNWTVSPEGLIIDGGGPSDNFIEVEWGEGPIGRIELEVEGCATAFCMFPSVVNVPIIGPGSVIKGPDQVCEKERALYSIPPMTGVDISWSVSDALSITDGARSHQLEVVWDTIMPDMDQQWIAVFYENCYLGCSNSDTLLVDILPNFYIRGSIRACQGSTQTYASLNHLDSMTYASNWSVFDAAGAELWTSAGSLANPEISWHYPPGKYTLQADIASPDDYCNDRFKITVEVVEPPPPVQEIQGATEVCLESVYTYKAISDNPFNEFTWTITDGQNVYQKIGRVITVTWLGEGPYSLALTQTSTSGEPCTSVPIELTIMPLTSFEIFGTSNVCNQEVGEYYTNYTDHHFYEWRVQPESRGTIISGQGSDTIQVQWHGEGTARIFLDICGLEEMINVFVHPKPDPEVIYPEGICLGESIMLQLTEPYSAYAWYNDQNTLISESVNPIVSPGTYRVEVTDAMGCTGGQRFKMEEYPLPEIAISTPSYMGICNGGPGVTLYALQTESNFSYQWFRNNTAVGSNAPTFTANQPGNYYVEVEDVNGCSAISNQIQLVDCASIGGECNSGSCNPVFGDGSGPGGCVPLGYISFAGQNVIDCDIMNFQNTSSNAVPGSLNWNFGDPLSGNNSSNQENPTHTYSNAGFYTVILTGQVPSSSGNVNCSDGAFRDILIPAKADFAVSSVCEGELTMFKDQSLFVPITSITNWAWDFGDPASGPDNSSTLSNPSHVFEAAGTYDVTLTITTEQGCTSSATHPVVVLAKPELSFTLPDLKCEQTGLYFEAGMATEYLELRWDFGDPDSGNGNTFEGPEAWHIFTAPGEYTISLFATNINGCVTSVSNTLMIEPNGLAGEISFSQPSPVCEGTTVTLLAPDNGSTWEWSNGAQSNSIQVMESGAYTVTLTDERGCSYSPAPAILDVVAAPTGSIEAVELNEYGQIINYFEDIYSLCEGEDVFLQTQNNPNYLYAWENGDHDYISYYTQERGNSLEEGEYNLAVTISDVLTGCSSQIGPFQVLVNGLPTNPLIASSPTSYCEGSDGFLYLTNPNPDFTYVWSTGETSDTISPGIGGAYRIIAINSEGCTNPSGYKYIRRLPDVNLVPTGCVTRCNPDTICLPFIPGVSSYQWFLNDEMIPAPVGNRRNLVVSENGDYYVRLRSGQCIQDSDILTIELEEGFGEIQGGVYADLNHNNVIDSGDTLITGIPVQLFDGAQWLDADTTGNRYAFDSIPSGMAYTLTIDTSYLPGLWTVENPTLETELDGCGDLAAANWLASIECVSSTYSSIELFTCPDEPLVYHDISLLDGTTTDVVIAGSNGCDSIVTVTVSSLPTQLEMLNLQTCPGTTADFNGTPLEIGTETEFVFSNIWGCDSTILVNVLALPTHADTLEFSACEGTSVVYNDVLLEAGSSTPFVFPNVWGCDSTVLVNVLPFPTHTDTLALYACEGTMIEYNNVSLEAGSSTPFVFSNVWGCDSSVLVQVQALPTHEGSLDFQTCPGSSITYHGTILLPGSSTVFVLENQFNCDSTITVNVTAFPTSSTTVDLQTCPGIAVEYNHTILAPGSQTEFLFTDSQGCDSTVLVSVTAYPEVTLIAEAEQGCWNTADGQINIQAAGETAPFRYSLDGESFQMNPAFLDLEGGVYTVWVEDAEGCLYESTLEVPVIPPLAVVAEETVLPCESEGVFLRPLVLEGGPEVSFSWPDGTELDRFWVESAGDYTLTVSNPCETIVLDIPVVWGNDGRTSYFYIPNAFSPNRDGINDQFQVFAGENIEVLSFDLMLFDRWGNQLYEFIGHEDNWDGFFRGKAMNPGVYVFVLNAQIIACGEMINVKRKGDVALVR